MNKVTVYGRVSTDIEVRDVNGRNVANFNVASQNRHKDPQTGEYGTNFYRVSAWGQAADTASKFLKKGHRVCVSGDLVIREFTRNDGTKGTAVEINNAEVGLVETKAESEAKSGGATQTAAPAPATATAPTSGDDELPF